MRFESHVSLTRLRGCTVPAAGAMRCGRSCACPGLRVRSPRRVCGVVRFEVWFVRMVPAAGEGFGSSSSIHVYNNGVSDNPRAFLTVYKDAPRPYALCGGLCGFEIG